MVKKILNCVLIPQLGGRESGHQSLPLYQLTKHPPFMAEDLFQREGLAMPLLIQMFKRIHVANVGQDVCVGTLSVN